MLEAKDKSSYNFLKAENKNRDNLVEIFHKVKRFIKKL